MPQDEESEAELKNLAAVPFQMISPANNSSIVGILVQQIIHLLLVFSKILYLELIDLLERI